MGYEAQTTTVQFNNDNKEVATNSFGDDMTAYLWDGPEDSDEEI